MNAAAFLLALRQRTIAPSSALDPLEETQRFLVAHGDTAEGQALRKVLGTIADGDGDYPEAELWLFGSETLALIAALVEARIAGRYSAAEWRNAFSIAS